MTEYTPTDEQMQADWHAYITTPDEDNYYYDALSSEEADARWSRWLAARDAHVRRDAAREALDGLINECRTEHEEAATNNRVGGMVLELHAQQVAMNYRDTHYPEETT